MAVVILIVLLGVLILAHEWGHFLVAKSAGIRVDEFGLGFPPRLVSWRRGETTYSLNLIPFGGFVKIYGEDAAVAGGPDEQRQMSAKPRLVQAAVLAAGVGANLVLAWLLIAVVLVFGLPAPAASVPQQTGPGRLVLLSVLPASPAAEAGLQTGDELVRLISGADQLEFAAAARPVVPAALDFIATHAEQALTVEYRRGGLFDKRLPILQTTTVTPRAGLIAAEPKRAALGVTMEEVVLWQAPFYRAWWDGAILTGRLTLATGATLVVMLGQAFQGINPLVNLTGPVGLVGVVGSAWQLGLVSLLSLAAIISINLAVINLFPIPALDGGRLLFLIIEAIKGKPLKPAVANWLNTAGAVLLIFLMVAITYRDILNLF